MVVAAFGFHPVAVRGLEGVADGERRGGADHGLVDMREHAALEPSGGEVLHQRRDRADHRVAGDGIAETDRRHELRAAFRHQPPQRLALQKLHRARLQVDDLEQEVRRAARRGDDEVEAVGGPRAALPQARAPAP